MSVHYGNIRPKQCFIIFMNTASYINILHIHKNIFIKQTNLMKTIYTEKHKTTQ